MSTGCRMSVSSFSLRNRSRKPRKSSFSYMSVLYGVVFHALPAADVLMHGAEVEHAPDGMVYQVVDGLGAAVERGHRREDHAAHLGDGRHVADVREVERGLAGDQHEA